MKVKHLILKVQSASAVQLTVQNITFLFTVLHNENNPHTSEAGTSKDLTCLPENYFNH